MVALLTKINRCLLITYNILRTEKGNTDITENADVWGEKDELGKDLSKRNCVRNNDSYPQDEKASEEEAQPVIRIPSDLVSLSCLALSACL